MYRKHIMRALFGSCVAMGISASAQAGVDISTVDYYYGNFSGSIADGSTGVNDTLSFDSAIYGGDGNTYENPIAIYFTDDSGIVTDVLSNGPGSSTGYWDRLTFYGNQSGLAAIGTTCAATTNIACLAKTGAPQELSATITTLNGGNGIYNGGTITVNISDVPEPASWMTMIGGFGLIGAAMRRRKAAVRFA